MATSTRLVALAALLLLLLQSSLFAVALPATPASGDLLALSVEKRLLGPPQPQDDPFYTPPSGFESSKPGDVLASRKISVAVLGLLPVPVSAYQVLYRTTAIDGSPIATVTTIFKPLGAKTDRFVSFQTAEDSNAPQCAPSYTYRLGAKQESLIVTVENLIIQLYLSKGYIVSAPDYEGPDGAFGAARLAGMGALDSMRAVKNFGKTLKLTTDSPAIVGVGYSGGAIATGWAAGLQNKYASELNVKGWAAGGVPANLTSVLTYIDGTIWAGFLPAAIQGLNEKTSYNAQVGPLVQRIATDNGKQALQYAKTHCAVEDLIKFNFQSVQSTEFQSLGDQLLYEPTVQSVLSQQTMGVNADETPVAPMLIYHSKPDEIIPYNETDKLVDRWCADGAKINFITSAAGGHITGEVVGVVDQVKFVDDTFAGNAPTSCTRETRNDSPLDPVALGLNLEPILIKLISALAKLGHHDSNVKGDLGVLNEQPE